MWRETQLRFRERSSVALQLGKQRVVLFLQLAQRGLSMFPAVETAAARWGESA